MMHQLYKSKAFFQMLNCLNIKLQAIIFNCISICTIPNKNENNTMQEQNIKTYSHQ